MISIGAVYHGPELRGSQINAVIVEAGKELNELRGPLKTGETPWMNAVFVVSGSLGTLCINRSPTSHPRIEAICGVANPRHTGCVNSLV
jgi:hypothetical protein